MRVLIIVKNVAGHYDNEKGTVVATLMVDTM